MIRIRKLLFLVFSLISSLCLMAQSTANQRLLTEAFSAIESQFKCNFAYQDEQLASHFVEVPEVTALDDALNFLRANTVFDYQVLQDLTITVSLKESAFIRCIQISLPTEMESNSSVQVISDYQSLTVFPGERIDLTFISNSNRISFEGENLADYSIPAGSLSSDDCDRIVLLQRMEYLKTVVLTNFISRGIDKNVDGSVTVDYQKFDILPGLIEPDVLQTIQALPGIQSVNETVSFINVRGGTNDQNLILWDGIKMYQSGHFFGLISAFNPFLTTQVDIIKNGSSPQYGDGVSGIVRMRGNDAINDTLRAGAGINLISGDAFIDLPLGKKASVQIAGRKSFNNLIETPTFDAYFDKAFQNTEVVRNTETESASDDEFTFYDTHVRLNYQVSDKDYVRGNFLLLGNQLQFLENSSIGLNPQSRQSELQQTNYSGGLYYKRTWNEKFNSEVQLYGSIYGLRAINFDIVNNQRLVQDNDIIESGVKVLNNFKLGDQLDLMAGYQFNETGITNFEQINNPFFERSDKQVLRTNSVFSEARVNIPTINTTISGGIRMNYIDKFDRFLFEPRINANYRFLQYYSIDISAEIKSQTTSQIIDFQNDFLGVENRRWVLSNDMDIPVIQGQQLSIGLNFSRKGWLVNIEPYIKHIDGITTQSQGFQNQFENIRAHGSYMVMGSDVLINKRFKNINTWLSYSYAENDYEFESLDPSEFPNNIDIRHTLNYGINYNHNGFKIAAGFNWHSGRPITNLVAGNEIVDGDLNFAAPNQDNLDDYIRVDISGTYEFGIGEKVKAFAGISFWNILNTENELNTFYRINMMGEPERVVQNALELTPNATFRINF